ncbi:hypothetical protein PV326_004037 [Microctonus aethiopoides]|nr:hypothetical protein PV326_004037 [Microctonus aethiopoides]
MSKDSKSVLKEARSLLNECKYVEAMQKCQKLLKENKTNYTALVLLGAAMHSIDEYKSQSPLAYKKAIALQPNNPLAWRGIVAFYESGPCNHDTWLELIPAYCKLMQLESTSPKFSHYLEQATKYSIILKDCKIIDELLKILEELREKDEIKEPNKIDEALAQIFSALSNVAKRNSKLYCKILEKLINNEDHPNHLESYKQYLKFLFIDHKYSAVIVAGIKMHIKYPRELCPLEWVCRIYSEQKILNDDFENDNNIPIEELYEALLKLDPNSYLAIFAKGIHLWQNDNLIQARDCLNQVVLLQPKSLYVWLALAEINVKLHCWYEVENAALNAFKLVHNSEKLYERIDLLLIESMARSGDKQKWTQAAQGCTELLNKNPTNIVKLLDARVRVLQQDPSADSLLSELETNPETLIEATILRALSLKQRESYEEAMDVIGAALETSEAWQIFGEINWKLSNYSHSHMAFLKGVQADPYNWECFVYLGHYYRDHGKNLEKSQKCYQKALRINFNSEEAGAGLSTAYRLLKNTEANMKMLQRVTTAEGGGPKWAWLQLGLQQLDQNEIAQAIKSLRYVIRADPNDNHCWESLADAYWARGAHTSALKSYQRALELSPGSLYPMIQLANIKLVLGRHVEAKEAFIEVLKQEQHYIPALKGLAETCLGLAKENSLQQLLGRAQRNIQQAVDSLTDAIVENSNLSCIWKLLGDACYRVAMLPENYSHLDVTPGLVKLDSEKERIEIRKSELFKLSARCYCRALSLTKDSPLLWHDLVCCYLSQLNLDPSANRKILAEKSLAAAKQAVRLCPTTWVHWNILGVVCMTEEIKNYALAQHCWVMAIDKEPNNAIAWTNLGTLYLLLGDAYKANHAFSRAQRADPDYQNSWVGQALIAESIDPKEGMDLFRHAIHLGYHPQAAVGYCHWVLTTLLDPQAKRDDPLYSYVIVNMHAIPVAADAMTWYIEREPNDICGRNCLGLLLERQKLSKSASREFAEALKLCKGQKEKEKENKIRINFARVLVQMGRYNEAIEICQGVRGASFNSHCQFALALFKAKRYEESYAAYNAALHRLADAGSDKAHVLCAMASMAYMFQDIDDVKTLLFQCIQIQPPTVAGLLAAAALGLLHNDFNLTTLVLEELKPYKDDPKYRHHVAVLSAYLCLMNSDVSGALHIISKAIHQRPDDVGSWIGLVRILLEINSSNFGNCAQKALYFGRKSSTVAVAQVACISSLGQLLSGNDIDGKCGLRSVQKSVHSFPGNIESWANLVVALSARCGKKNAIPNASWLSKLISIIREKLKHTTSMDEWLVKNEERIKKISSAC